MELPVEASLKLSFVPHVDDGLGISYSVVNVSVSPSTVIVIDSPKDGSSSKSNEKVIYDRHNSLV